MNFNTAIKLIIDGGFELAAKNNAALPKGTGLHLAISIENTLNYIGIDNKIVVLTELGVPAHYLNKFKGNQGHDIFIDSSGTHKSIEDIAARHTSKVGYELSEFNSGDESIESYMMKTLNSGEGDGYLDLVDVISDMKLIKLPQAV